jgi:hypothetical protein
MNSRTSQFDTLDILATTALRWVTFTQRTFTTFFALTDNGLIAFDFKNMPPFELLPTGTLARFRADRIAFAFRATITGIKDILAIFVRSGLLGNNITETQ